MALTNYDDPYQDPQNPQDPYQNPGYVPPAGPLVEGGPGSVPTFYGGVNADSGKGGGLPFGSLLHVLKLIPSIFHLFGGGGSSPSNPTPDRNRTPVPNPTPTPIPVGPPLVLPNGLPLSSPPPASSNSSSLPKQLAGMSPEILALVLGLLNKPEDVNANNPALAALGSAVPKLTEQLNALLQNDVQRRQMSDPLYQAVLTGAMGGLPVWMRGGGGLAGALAGPRTGGSGVPSTPATDLFRAQGNDPEGYAFPNTRV